MLVSNGVWQDRIILSIGAYKKVLGPMIMTIIKLLRLRNPPIKTCNRPRRQMGPLTLPRHEATEREEISQ